MSEIVSVENFPAKAKYITVKLHRQEAFDLVAGLKQAYQLDRYAFNLHGRPSDLVDQLEKALKVNQTASEYNFTLPRFASAFHAEKL